MQYRAHHSTERTTVQSAPQYRAHRSTEHLAYNSHFLQALDPEEELFVAS